MCGVLIIQPYLITNRPCPTIIVDADALPSPLSQDLIDETVRSLALLLPSINGQPNKWFQRKQQEYQRRQERLDTRAGLCGHLNAAARQIDNFKYWRDRITILKQAFDDAEPRSISSLWYDDRKKIQWYIFWVTVLVFLLTMFFGMIQSVSGIVQAWSSVQSLRKMQQSILRCILGWLGHGGDNQTI